MTPPEINTHNLVCDFGKHAGTLYTQMPVSYLKWMVCVRHQKADIAAAELKRRGTITPHLDVSGHAIDRASLSCRKQWHKSAMKDEGIHAWLCRMAQGALDHGRPDEKHENRYLYSGMFFCFEMDGVWPVLKTVIPAKKRRHQ